MQPNSDVSFLSERKASAVNLESVSKSTLSNCISLSHCKAKNKPSASPTSTWRKQGCNTVFANTKLPSWSRIHIPMPVRLRELEKATSILHLYRPSKGHCHRLAVCNADTGGPPLRVDEGVVEAVETLASRALANCQSTTMFRACSTTRALVSVMSSQTLRLRCFQILHSTVAKCYAKSVDNIWSREKIASVADEVVESACWMDPHRPVPFQTWIAKGQAKKTWAKSSYPESQLAQFIGHVTPLSSSRTRIGKRPLQMRQIRFFSFLLTLCVVIIYLNGNFYIIYFVLICCRAYVTLLYFDHILL